MEIMPERILYSFEQKEPRFKVKFTYKQNFKSKAIITGGVPIHRLLNGAVTTCIDYLFPQTGIPCPCCTNSKFNLIYDFKLYKEDDIIYLNRLESNNTYNINPTLLILTSFCSKHYKHPLTPAIFNKVEIYPSYILPQLQHLYNQFYDYSHELIKEVIPYD